jgi:hypothetical protein
MSKTYGTFGNAIHATTPLKQRFFFQR